MFGVQQLPASSALSLLPPLMLPSLSALSLLPPSPFALSLLPPSPSALTLLPPSPSALTLLPPSPSALSFLPPLTLPSPAALTLLPTSPSALSLPPPLLPLPLLSPAAGLSCAHWARRAAGSGCRGCSRGRLRPGCCAPAAQMPTRAVSACSGLYCRCSLLQR
jgi:hypothetical protein